MKSTSTAARALHVVPDRQTSIGTPGGAKATVMGEVVSIHRADGALVASFDASTGELRIEAPGDLRLAAPRGRVVVDARDGVAVRAGDAAAAEASTIDIRPEAIGLRGAIVDIAAGALELRAERILERATDIVRDVDGLLETRAKRLRTIVATTLSLFSRRTAITSEQDTRIDGKRVLLG